MTATEASLTGTAALLAAVGAGTRTYDLARPLFIGMPQSPNHPEYRHAMPRRHGDMVRADGGSAANDLIVMGTHVGTHIDALCHVSHDGKLHGGHDAYAAQVGGKFGVHSVDQIEPMVCRGVLLDVGVREGGDEVTPDELDAAVQAQGTAVNPGDVVLIRTGWGRHWDDRDAYIGKTTGVPGVAEAGAKWLAERSPRAVGGDSIAFECLKAGAGHALLPAHRVLLVERGINIIETLALEELAADKVHEFLFVLSPLPLTGATGSPVRPLAVVAA